MAAPLSLLRADRPRPGRNAPEPDRPHEMSEDFPGKADLLPALKDRDPQSRRFADDHHAGSRAAHRAEARTGLPGE